MKLLFSLCMFSSFDQMTFFVFSEDECFSFGVRRLPMAYSYPTLVYVYVYIHVCDTYVLVLY